jgi:hypothetical protein
LWTSRPVDEIAVGTIIADRTPAQTRTSAP